MFHVRGGNKLSLETTSVIKDVDSAQEKIKRVFPENGIIIHKNLASLSDHFKKLPSFVVDYLISTFVDVNDVSPGIAKINQLLVENYVSANEKELVKSRIKERGQHSLLGDIRCRYDQSKDEYFAEIAVLGDQFVRVSPYVIAEYGDALLSSGMWGTITVAFDPYKIKSRLYPFLVIDFVPFQITNIDLDGWIERRNEFTDKEWSDLMINSIGFDPRQLSEQEKIVHFMRLMPFVEPNINLVELGPPETGKTFTYRSLSSFGFVISGSKTTIASLFYNKLRRQLGVIGQKDCVMFDEIAHAEMNGQEDLINMLKDFMNTGRFARGNSEFGSECSIIFGGNIDCDRSNKTVKGFYRHLFMPLPRLIHNDRAFLDRLHGFIPGWEAAQIAECNLSQSYGFMADFLSEVMHKLRDRNYAHIILEHVDFGNMTLRNQTAITRMSSALLKLLYPHKTINTIQNNELKYVLDIAVSLRQRVVEQLAIIAPAEFGNIQLNYTLRQGG